MGSTDLSESEQCKADATAQSLGLPRLTKVSRTKEWYARGRCWVGRNKSGTRRDFGVKDMLFW